MALPTANLFLRYRVGSVSGITAGQAIASIPDTSGVGNPAAAQATSTKQALATQVTIGTSTFWAADFDGADDAYDLTGTALNALRNRAGATIVSISRVPARDSSSDRTVAFSTGTSATAIRGAISHTNALQSIVGRRADTDSEQSAAYAVGPPTASWQVHTATFTYSAATALYHINGTERASNLTFQTAGNTSDTASLGGAIGSGLGGTQYADVMVAEILVYTAALTTAERAALHSYVQDTYGITVSDYTTPPPTGGSTTWTHAPELLTHANGFALAHLGTTDPAAGAVLQAGLTVGGTAALTFQSGRWRHDGNPGIARLELPVPNAPRLSARWDFQVLALPTGAVNRLVELRSTNSNSISFRLNHNLDGTLRIFNAANAGLPSTPATPFQQPVVGVGDWSLGMHFEPGDTTANGKLRLYLYDSPSATTPIASYTSDAFDLGAGATITSLFFGRVSSTAGSTGLVETIGLQANDINLNQIGARAVSSGGNAGVDQIGKEPGQTVVLTGTGTGTWAMGTPWPSGVPTVVLEAGATANVATFDFPLTLNGATLPFTYGSDTMTVTGFGATDSIRLPNGTEKPLQIEVVQPSDVIVFPEPVDDPLLAVADLAAVQRPGTRFVDITWRDPNIPPAVRYRVTELRGLNTTVDVPRRSTPAELATGDYTYTVIPEGVNGEVGPGQSVSITVTSSTATPPVITTTLPGATTNSLSWTHSSNVAVTVRGELRLTADGPVVNTFVGSFAAGQSFVETYTGLAVSTDYYRSIVFTSATGSASENSISRTNSPAAAVLKYERFGPVLANDNDPLPASAVAAGWRKIRILSRTTYTIDDGPTVGFSGNIGFQSAPTSNNLVIMPRTATLSRNGGISLVGGHGIAVRGGEINSNWMTEDQYWFRNGSAAYGQTHRKGMQLLNQTGHVEVEGLYVHGPHLNDALWVNPALTTITGGKRYITLQNCFFTDVRAPSTDAMFGRIDEFGVNWGLNTLHQDCLQIMGNGTNTVIGLYQCLFESSYQGIMDNMGENVELELERTHFNMTLRNTNDTQSIGYAIFLGSPVRVGPEVTVRNPVRLNGFSQQRQVGYPETVAKWAGIQQIVTTTRADPTWRATAWAGTKNPGMAYVAA